MYPRPRCGAGFVGYGVVLSWLFSREFADGTITGLFAIPVSRRTIAAAKLIVYLAWGLVTAGALLFALILLGLVSGLGPIPADAVPSIGRRFGLPAVSIVIPAPALWAIHADVAVTPVQLALVLPVVALGVVLTVHSWHRLPLDR